HLAQCPACRGRLDEERALITRAGELLALAAPPDRELPPFRRVLFRSPTRLWWKVRLPLAWAATLVLALGIGTYLGSGVEQRQQPETAADAEPARPQALESPLSSERARRESRVKLRGAARTPPAAPAAPGPAARRETDGFVQERKAQVAVIPRDTALSAATPARAPAPQPAFVMVDGALVEKTSRISLDSARVAERGPLSRARIADSLAAAPAAKAAARLGRYETRNRVVRRLGDLEVRVSGPLPSDSLGKLLQLVQPVKP